MFSFPIKLYDRLWYLVRQTFILMLALTALRFFFLFWNWQVYSVETPLSLINSLVVGWRFDASALAILLSPLILLRLLPFTEGRLERGGFLFFHRFWLCFSVLLLLVPNISDTEHFHFIHRRSTLDLFANPKDFRALLLPIMAQYWWLILGAFLFIGGVLRVSLKLREKPLPLRFGPLGWSLHFIVLLAATVLIARGGLQRRPMNASHAFLANPSANLAALSLNSTYTLLRSMKARHIEPLHYFPDNQELGDSLRAMQTFVERPVQLSNVIILIMESMGTEFMGIPNHQESRIPFVESFEHKGLLFENNFANGGETGFVFDSVLASLPQMMPGSIIGSAYETNKIIGLGSILKGYGYQTFFFHGGPRGLFYFDIRARRLGFDQHFTMADYGDKDFDGEWGIFDEPFLQFMASKLEQAREPFAAAFLSLSNHPPYKLPQGYKPPHSEWTPKEQTALYADQAIETFFARVREFSWFKNTLFVITGDHAPFEKHARYVADPLGGNRVPLVFYHPKETLPQMGRSLRITQQADIIPSVLDLLGLAAKERDKITPFGRSVFTDQKPGLALVYHFGSHGLISGGDYSVLTADGQWQQNSIDPLFFNLEPSLPHVELEKHDNLLKAFVQFYHFALIENRLYP